MTMRCLLSCNGIFRPTTVRQLALGVGATGTAGSGGICLDSLMTLLGPAQEVEYVPMSSRRVCQLTANADPEGLPHLNHTIDWGCDGTDLGFSVEHNGRLYIFFGDVMRRDNADPIAYMFALDPEPENLLLTPILEAGGTEFRAFNVRGSERGYLPVFETPTGGFSHAGQVWMFVVRGNRQPYSQLVRAPSPEQDFEHVLDLSRYNTASRFSLTAPCVIKNSDWLGVPDEAKQYEEGVFLWGFGKSSVQDRIGVHLAWLPLPQDRLPRRDDVQFWKGTGTPAWSSAEEDSISLFIVPQTTLLSVAWLADAQRWLMLYTRASEGSPTESIVCRVGRTPWEWSEEAHIFNPVRDSAFDRFMDPPSGLRRLEDPSGHVGNGFAYAPGIVNRFTRWDPDRRTVTLFYTMSTNSPYQVQLMASQVRIR